MELNLRQLKMNLFSGQNGIYIKSISMEIQHRCTSMKYANLPSSKVDGDCLLTTWVVKISRRVPRNFLDERSEDLFICSCLRS